MKKIVLSINKYYSRMIAWGVSKNYLKHYKKLFRIKGTPNKHVEGESEHCEKWSVLSRNVNPIYYRYYSAYIGKDVNILPEDICHNVIENLLNPPIFKPYYEDKNIYDKIIPREYLPKTILRKINGFFYDSDYSPVDVDDALLNRLISVYDKIITKPTVDSCSGKNVMLFVKSDNGRFVLINDRNTELNIDYINSVYPKDFIIQECLKQSDYMSAFNPDSVNTFRILVYRSVKTDEITVPNAVLRIGANGSYVDNSHAGGVSTGISDDGKLSARVIDQHGKVYSNFNGIDFANDNFTIPNFEGIITFAKQIGKYITHHRCICLDVMVDSNNSPKIIEFNLSDMSVWLFQYNTGPVFGKYTDEIIEYCRQHLRDIEMIHLIK